MPNPERCRERAQDCRRRAELVSDARDRAKWLQLATKWLALSRISFQSDSAADKAHVAQNGPSRGESVGRGTNYPRLSSGNPMLKAF
jgi:hypothetical protein